MNPIRDTVFLGNQTAYDTWGMISTGISLGAVCSPALASQQITVEGTKQAVTKFLSSGVSNIAKESITFAGKTALVGGSGVVVEKVVAPYTSEDFGRLSGLLAGAYVGSKVFGVKKPKTISYSDYDDIYQQSIHNAGKDKVMLGKFDGGGDSSYITKAGTDYEYFSLGDWDEIKAQFGFSDDDMFHLFNEAFLDDGINAAKTFHFSHNPIGDLGALGREYQYLLNNNYKWDAITMTMHPSN